MTKTIHIESDQRNSLEQVIDELRETIEGLLDRGSDVAVTVADEQEELSPEQAGKRLGFSRQHVRRLIDAGVLEGHQLPGSGHWRVPIQSVLRLEEQRAKARKQADKWSRELDRLGAPLE